MVLSPAGAHAMVARAKLGNPAATRTVIATLQGAEGGNPLAIANGQQLSAADKLQTRAELVAKWVDADAAQRILHPTTQWG
jgi:putative heme iron utilization protein